MAKNLLKKPEKQQRFFSKVERYCLLILITFRIQIKTNVANCQFVPNIPNGQLMLTLVADTIDIAKYQPNKKIHNRQLKMATRVFPLEDFSDEIILKVFCYLEKDDLFKCSLTSRRFRAICHDRSLPQIWKCIQFYNTKPIWRTMKNPNWKIPGFLHINLKKFTDQLLQDIVDKGCKYLVLSHYAESEHLNDICKYYEPFKLELFNTFYWKLINNNGLKNYHASFRLR